MYSLTNMLKLDFCTFKTAKYAVENWHYSKQMPAGKLIKIGVWEQDKFIGAVIFGRGANNNLHKHFKLQVTEVCELVRVALREHETPVTRIVAVALKMLKKSNPGIKLVASYADITNQGHKGTIYIAGNWKYHGVKKTTKSAYYRINGRLMHGRTVRSKWGSDKNIPYPWEYAEQLEKHLFSYSLRD